MSTPWYVPPQQWVDDRHRFLHEALAPFIEHARQIGRGSGRGRGRRQPATDKHTRSNRE